MPSVGVQARAWPIDHISEIENLDCWRQISSEV